VNMLLSDVHAFLEYLREFVPLLNPPDT
jgi:hypothetical protein